MKINKLQQQSQNLSGKYRMLEEELLKLIIKRLKTDKLARLTKDQMLKWQFDRLAELAQLQRISLKFVLKRLPRLHQETQNLINVIASESVSHLDQTLRKITGKKSVSMNQVHIKLQALQAEIHQQMDEHVHMQLLSRNANHNPVCKAYKRIIHKTVAKVVTGVKTPEAGLADAVYEFQDQGFDSGLVDKAGRTWSMQGYTSTVLENMVTKVAGAITNQRMKDYDYQLVLYPVHNMARPACADIQGGVVNLCAASDPNFNSQYPSVYDYGYPEPDGTLGVNCSHVAYTPFDPSTMVNNLQDLAPSPDVAIANEALASRQRVMERQIRSHKAKLTTAKQLGDKKGINKYKSLIRTRQSCLRDYVKQHDVLHRDYRREKVY